MNLYTFYCDGDKFFDPRIPETALSSATLNMKVNSAGELTFTLPPEHPKNGIFEPLTSTIEIFRDDEWFWEGRIVDESTDFIGSKTYICEGALAYLNDSIQPQKEYSGVTPWSYVEQILNTHNSQVAENRKIYLGAVNVTDPNNRMSCYTNYNTSLQELKEDIIDDLGGYCRFRKRDNKLYLDILADFDRTCTQTIRIGENLLDLIPNRDFTDIASVIIPLGAALEDQEEHDEGLEALDKYVEISEVNDGKNYIARDDLLESYDQIWRVVRFDNIHTPQGLLNKAKEYLLDGQWGDTVIEAKAFDLNYTDEEFQEFRLLDRVRVISPIHNLDRYFPIMQQTINFLDVSQNSITLGGTGEDVTITGVTNQVTVNTEKLDERIKDPNRLIQQAIWQATELINQGLNGYVRVNGNEILIMDTDDPATAKHVWRWNMGGLGYSNNGYNGPFETAITMDGTIVGKFLAANSVAAEQIDVNYTSHVEKQCNDYTDSKLGDYWTYSETETYFQTLADEIRAGVTTTLTGYVTEQELSSQLEITESNITTTVTNRLKSYSTTTQVQSMIDQAADSITTTLSKYVSDSEFQQLEQKITAEGIFTTINSGIGSSGNQSIKNTYFTMDKNGITVQNGGLTVKNRHGTTVLSVDTSGNLNMNGNLVTGSSDAMSSGSWSIRDDVISHFNGTTTTFQILSETIDNASNTTISCKNNIPLTIYSSGMKVTWDNTGVIFNNNGGQGNIYCRSGGKNYPGINQYVHTNENYHLHFINGICIEATQT